MANYNQVSYGSGDKKTVTELQKLLNQNGANLTEDGIFGSQTQQAVKNYQQANNLTVDGIVGNQTWGALTKAAESSAQPTTQAPAQTPAQQEVTAPTFEYKPSDTVAQAEALLQQQLAQKPGAYQSTWQDQLNETLQQILNRDKFSYDLNGDMLYQQYKDQYTTQGKLASMDVMGQAAAMTGGYGNSYAQTAGQQAYQSYLQKLNEVVPELYGMARDQYNQEGQALYDQASLMAQMEDQDYGRYRDQMSDYYTELNRLTENARYMSETEYQKAMDDFNIKYGSYRDTVSDQQWQAQFDEAKRQYDEQMALSQSKSSNNGSSNGSGKKYTAPKGWDAEKIKAFQKAHDLTVDGIWGSQSQAAYDADPDWEPGSPITNFAGTTYSEAVAYAKANGVGNSYASSILTKSEFARAKASGSSRDGANEFDTYQEYLEYAVESMIDAYGKG